MFWLQCPLSMVLEEKLENILPFEVPCDRKVRANYAAFVGSMNDGS